MAEPVSVTSALLRFGALAFGFRGGRDVDPFAVSAATPITPSSAQVDQARRELSALREANRVPSSFAGAAPAPSPESPSPGTPDTPPSPEPSPPSSPPTPAPEPVPPPVTMPGMENFTFPAGLFGPPVATAAAAELSKISSIVVAAMRGGFYGLLGGLFSEDLGKDDTIFGEPGPVVIMTIPPPGTLGPSQAQFPKVSEVKPPKIAKRLSEISAPSIAKRYDPPTNIKKALRKISTATGQTPAAKPSTAPAPAPAPAGLRIPPGIIRNFERLLLLETARRALSKPKAGQVVPGTAPNIIIQPPPVVPGPSPSEPTPPSQPVPSPPPVGSVTPIPSLPGTITPALSPAFARQAQRERTRDRECRVVKRRRRRRKCREGYFVEEPGKTTYTTWRVKECVSGKTIAEL